MKTVLAVDLGGTKTATALVAEGGLIAQRRKQPAGRSLEASVAQIAGACVENVNAAGVVVPGIYDERTGNAWCPNLWGTNEVPLRDELLRKLNVPVCVDSDRAGYVLGESWMGVARGLENVVFVAIGTGIGAGILAGGLVVRGAHGIAGAVGWMTLEGEWRPEFAACGNWEHESAGPAVARAYGAAQAEAVVEAARRGDERAAGILKRAASVTGRGVANLISVLNPEMVVLGGGLLEGAAEFMLETVRSEAMRWAQPISARKCRIEMTQLGEDAAL
ncbi:MAG: ROK family protein, partial [Bryobacteraceae bacterium]|nr:ROK family protein [Bryobacteraceae bacterium]